jgi:hypothetical protein
MPWKDATNSYLCCMCTHVKGNLLFVLLLHRETKKKRKPMKKEILLEHLADPGPVSVFNV